MYYLNRISIFACVLFAFFVNAQDVEITELVVEVQDTLSTQKKFSFSGSADVYYRGNFTEEQYDQESEALIAPYTAFANLPGFALGMANFIASYEGEKVGFVADLVYGPRGNEAVFNSSIGSSSSIINQLYAYYSPNEWLTFTLGNFNTFLGYEVISPVGNFNYSTSYMFTNGPFSHSGLKADVILADKWSAMVAIMNVADETEANLSSINALGFQLGYDGQYLNILTQEDYFQIDFTGGIDLDEVFFLGLNATIANLSEDVSFSGVAVYPQYSFSDTFQLGARVEYFSEKGGFGSLVEAGDASNVSYTLTGNFVVKDLIIKAEFRLDNANAPSPVYLVGNNEYSNEISSFLVAFVYPF